TLFDCCHSAGIVRNALRIDTFKLVEKRIPYVFAKRNWEQFIFSSRLSREDVAALGEMTAIPEADFIHLSACKSNESAVEYDGEGVFTKYLLKVLSSETRGLTYETLHNRIRQYLRGSFD